MDSEQRYYKDILIIGSGLAGLFAALEAAANDRKVTVITKVKADECNTRYAQGGIACVITEEDSFSMHVEDTLQAGSGLCHEDVVSMIVKSGPEMLKKLVKYGIKFTRRSELEEDITDEEYDLGREGGHSKRRILHAGDITGEELIKVLLERCHENENIQILENHIAIDLISTRHLEWQGENSCMGAYVLDRDNNRICTFISNATILATGGAGKVYLYTSNPDVASGDGIAMAYRAYAEIRNMEFFQFHPTCLFHPKAKSFLISEAVRGEGAVLKIKRGNKYVEFMKGYHELANLAPRDIVARAIDNELKRTGQECAYLDIRHQPAEFIKKRFPNIYEKCLHYGFDMTKDMIPVVPAAHYCCGGIKTDCNGASTVSRLYAVGEAAGTGLHGANRLASNSLLEAVVMANNAVQHALVNATTAAPSTIADIPDWHSGDAVDSDEQIVISHNWDEIRSFMWDYVGIVRTNKRLERAKNRIRLLRKEIEKYYWDFTITADLIELRNIASVAEMIIDSASARKESHGLHYNANYEDKSGQPGRDTVLRRPAKAEIWYE